MRLALAQISSDLGNVDANLERAHEALREAQKQGAEMVVFPELTLTGYVRSQAGADVSLPARDPRLESLGRLYPGVDVLVGFDEDGGGVHNYNAAGYYDESGLVYCHRKLFLPTYDVFEERKHFSPGQTMRAFETRHGKVASLICNDAWQPQLPFLAVQEGARVLFIPTNSAQSLSPHKYDSETYWHDISVFYARMFQCYVVFVNRVGEETGFRFWGGSHVVDPWGEIIAQAENYEEDLLLVDIDLGAVRRRRLEVPLVREARLMLLAREAHRIAEEGGDA